MGTSVWSRLYHSKTLHPILSAISWEQLLFFAALLNLLPGIADNSLFDIYGLAYLDFLAIDRSDAALLTYKLPLVALVLGLIPIIRTRRFGWLLTLTPGVLVLLAWVRPALVLDHPIVYAQALSIACKLSCLFFCVNGHIRSLGLFLFLGLAFYLINLKQVLLFVLVLLVLRFTVLAIRQNYEVLSEISGKKLLHLMFKSLLLWSPILLFTIPEWYATKKLKEITAETIYNETFVERHDVMSAMPIERLVTYSVADTLNLVSAQKYPRSNIEERQRALDNSLTRIQTMSDSGLYKGYPEELADFEYNYGLRMKAYTGNELDRTDKFILNHVNYYLEKIAIRKRLVGRNELEMDIELSIYQNLLQKNKEINASLDQAEDSLDMQAAVQKAHAEKAVEEFIEETETFKIRAVNLARNEVDVFKSDVDASRVRFEQRVYASLDSIAKSVRQEINKTPDRTQRAFTSTFPPLLTDVSDKFAEDDDCGLLDAKCHASNYILEKLQDVYQNKREDGVGKSKEAGQKAADYMNDKLTRGTTRSKEETTAALKAAQTELNQAADNAVDKTDAAAQKALIASTELLESHASAVTDKIDEVQEELKAANDSVRIKLEQAAEEINQATQQTIAGFQLGGKLLNWFSQLVLWFIVINSYLYVFSRVAFSRETDLFVSVDNGKEWSGTEKAKACGTTYVIPAGSTEEFYFSRKYEPTGRAPKLVIPQWATGLVSRVKNKCYFMNEVEARPEETEPVTFRSIAGAEFIEWDLGKEDEIVLNYKNLVAATTDVNLSTLVSVRLTSVLLGRFLFHVARGPGKVVLLSKGQPIIAAGESEVRSLSVDRLLSWHKNAKFSVKSELNLIDIYFSSLYISRHDEHPIIIDTDDSRYERKVGMFRFVKRFLLP